MKLGNIGDWGAGATPNRSNKSYYENGDVLWVKTGELNDGYIFDSIEKITTKALNECSLRNNNIGDVLIAMYGATIGKLGIAAVPLTTNQACCACTPFSFINNEYLFYYLMAIKPLLISKSYGGAQPNISKEKITNCFINFPKIDEQILIVNKIKELFKKIETIDNEYNSIINLISATKRKVLEEIFGENSSYKSYYENYRPIRELCHTLSVTSKEVKLKDVKPEGKFPVVSQSKQLIDGYSDNQNNVISDIPIIIFGDHTRVVKYINFHFIPGADGTKILKTINLESKYFYYGVLYASGIIDNKGYARHFSKLKNVLLPIPNKQNQNKIVKYLDNAFKLLDSIV